VDKVDFVTSVGFLTGGDARQKLGMPGKGPAAVITNLCILRPNLRSRELEVVSTHPGVDRTTIAESTGWEIRFAEECGETEAPRVTELDVLRELKARTAAAHGMVTDEA
jgi:glutaconate CoA-transferase subunit B